MIELGFLFWLFFIGIVVAVFQDLKRREVDNWLNLFLLVASFSFIFFRAIFDGDSSIIFQAGFLLVFLFVVINVFYCGRVFAGGDAKLLFAMTVFFVGANFGESLINIGVFVLFLMVAGSVYGLVYSLVLYVRNFRKVNKEIHNLLVSGRWSFWFYFGFVLVLFGFIYWVFFVFGIFVLLGLGLYIFTKGLENVLMVRVVSGEELREGDWLVDDVILRGVAGRRSQVADVKDIVIRADWDGLSSGDIELLKKRKKIKIKEGLPFVPAFLIAFLGYVFLRSWIMRLFMGF